MIEFDNKLAAFRIAKAAEVEITPFAVCISSHDRDGALEGGAIFEGFNGATVHTHVAGFAPGWCRAPWLYAVSDFCFNKLKVRKVMGIVPLSKPGAIKFDLNFGFRPECVIEDYFPTGAAQVMSLTRDNCRFLGDKYRAAYEKDIRANAIRLAQAAQLRSGDGSYDADRADA